MADTLLDEAVEAGVWAVPYRAVPPMTNRGVTHEVVEVDGYVNSYANITQGFGLVYGRTRCGIRDLLLDRRASGFPDCRRCYRAVE